MIRDSGRLLGTPLQLSHFPQRLITDYALFGQLASQRFGWI
jgi:hypothetical protein